VPNPGKGATGLVCYAAHAYASMLAQCEQIVAKLTLIGQSQYDLNPDPVYAGRLGGLIRSLDSQRLALRRQMQGLESSSKVGKLAAKLADDFARTATSLSTLEAPLATGSAQAALTFSIQRARDTYRALADAADAEDLRAYNLSLGQVGQSESGVDRALEGFALMGYNHS
jgi:hypothetical protein